MTRRERLLAGLDLRLLRGIEVGPLASPVVSKDESNVKYVDYCSKEDLIKHYLGEKGVDTDKIVDIDGIWGKVKLKECLQGFTEVDYVIASHVIEHVPDFLGWLHEVAEVLRDGGRLGLVIPDKRFTFDFLRQPTRLNEIIDAYLRGNRRPSPAQIFDNHVNVSEVNKEEAWRGTINPSELKRYTNPQWALEQSISSIREEIYIDVHCWVFTPQSLLEIFVQLADLDLLPFRCQKFYDTEENDLEMSITLEKLSKTMSSPNKEEIKKSFQFYFTEVCKTEEKRRSKNCKKSLIVTRGLDQKTVPQDTTIKKNLKKLGNFFGIK